MNLDEAIARTKEASESQRLGELGRETALQLAAWLEELKQYKEENQPETNLDHYKQEVLENCMWNLAVVDGRPKQCSETRCSKCEFNKKGPRECHKKRIEWLKQPHIKPVYKLTRFEYDLLRSNNTNNTSHDKKLIDFATYRNLKEIGYFKNIDFNLKIDDILANHEIKEEE